MPSLFSDNFERFLYSLQPRGPVGDLAFPAGISWRDARIVGTESPRDMLARCANAGSGGLRACLIEDDLAVFAFIRWRDRNRLASASIQAIKTLGVDIDAYVAGGAQEVQYFRLDIDRRTGLIFTHPYPHIHHSGGGVRYSLNGWRSSNVVIDFFEHIYIQCYHGVWLTWAAAVWNQHWSQFGDPAVPNPFPTIVAAFRESQYAVLEQYDAEVRLLKRLLRDSKDNAYRLRVDEARCELLGYPCT